MPSITSWFRRVVVIGPLLNAPPDEEGEKPKPAGGTAGGAVDPNADSKQLAEGMAGIRSLLQRTGTAIGAAATAILVGLGWAELHESFPIPENVGWGSKVLLAVSLVAAVVGSAWLAARFFTSQRRILVASDLSKTKDLGREKKFAQRVLDEHAAEEGAASLHALELRALRFDRVARRLDKPEDDELRKRLTAEAARLCAVVGITLSRAAATVLEARARTVFRSVLTAALLFVAAFGIVGLFVVADYYKGERSLFELRQKCLKAEKEGVTDACAAFETADQTTARQDAAEAKRTEREGNAAAPGTVSVAQKEALQLYGACQTAINKRPDTRLLPAAVKANAIEACAAAK